MTSGGNSRHDSAGRSIDEKASRSRFVDDRTRIHIELDAPHQADAAHVDNRCVMIGQRAESRLQMLADARDMGEQATLDELINKVESCAARQQVAAVGAAVIAKRNSPGNVLVDECRTDRHTRTEGFTDGHQLRLEAERVKVERISGPSQAALDFVGNEQRATFSHTLRSRPEQTTWKSGECHVRPEWAPG